MTLPVALSGTDVIGQAKTGTGKTLGFGLPLLERVTVPADVEAGRAKPEALTDAPQALVVVPTRELCTQVTNDLLTAGKVRNVRVLAIYGGRAYEPQVEALKKGVDVIVGTPGRLLDLAGQKKLNLKHIKALVLDEADEMLDLGFLPDVEKIINMLPARRQTMLFSATMPGAVIGLARRYMSQPTHIRATAPDDEGATVANTAQFVYRAHNMDKPEMVARILQADGRGLAMVFCRTKRTAADLADQLQQRGFAAGAVHGDLGQGAREQALRAFRNGKVDVLVCTDVAARGIDVEGVTHVINYQSPEEEKTYLHRIGRTGRAGAKGIAITLVDWDDIPRWQLINKALDLKFNDPPETYSTSPHLFEELNIPAGTKGVLPRSERTRAGLGAEELEDLGETGGRGARGRGGRGGRDESRSSSSSSEGERPARTPRRRRRTRGGASLEGTAAPATGPVAAAETVETTSAEAVTAPRTPRRRRRTRGGASPEPTAAVTATSSAPEAAEAAVATAEGPSLATTEEASAKPRRRRTRKSAEPKATSGEAVPTPEAEAEAAKPSETAKVAEAVQPSEAAAAPQVAEPDEAPATKPRRRTRKATAPAEAALDTAEGTTEAVQETPEAAETKPRRRTRKATPAAEASVDTAEGTTEAVQETPEAAETTPRRRTRKATAAAEVAVDTAEAAEAKPKARRTRKTAATAEAAEIPAQTAQEPEAAETAEAKPKARRTRKATAGVAAEAAVDTAEAAEAKPRTRRTRKAAAPAEAAVDTAEGTEAKPRRTRKTAAAVAEPEAAEAKPRRTRKATAAAEVAVDTAEAAEAKPKARRTRKTAATAEAAAPAAEIPAQATREPAAAEAPAPRRRARKAAATVAEAADGTAEVKPKVRRTRKATAAVEPAES
ncbi:DEAD/DEAH box helicase [Streptomyces sp. V4I8]|uniref:DEAD/DEAH box helicase n=1 Tax=Streptomyces sp. V4I8 TaxID=3156469 RepID=UPI003511A7A5